MGKKEPKAIAKNNLIHDINKQSNSCQCLDCSGVEDNNTRHKAKSVDYLDEQNPSTRGIEKALLNSIETALKDANSYEEAMQSLLETYADMDVAELEKQFFKQIANSQILASAEIENENGN